MSELTPTLKEIEEIRSQAAPGPVVMGMAGGSRSDHGKKIPERAVKSLYHRVHRGA